MAPTPKPKPKPKPKAAGAVERAKQRNYRRPPNQLTVERVVKALRDAAGIRAVAAERLQVDRATITKFVHAHPEVLDQEREIVEELADLAEGKLYAGIRNGEFPSIKFFLECKARDRGYGRAIEVTGKDRGPVDMNIGGIDITKLSIEQLRQYEALLAAGGAGATPDVGGV